MNTTKRLTAPRRCFDRLWVITLIGVSLLAPVYAAADSGDGDGSISWDGHLTITSPDENYELNIGGRFQPRYEFETTGEEFTPEHSSLYLRRARLDFWGHVFTPELTFRLMPELSRTATLRDGWLNYRFADWLEIKTGQFQVPFAAERDASSNRHQFMERSRANNEFEWPTGRDIGVGLHGVFADRFRYSVGGFSGQGRNAAESTSVGHLVSGRLTGALAGEYPEAEALVEPAAGLNAAVGIGTYLAWNNDVRDWWGRGDDVSATPADVLTGTADVHFQWRRLSMNLAGFAQGVRLTESGDDGAEEIAVDSYRGFGVNGHVGALLIPKRLFAAVRFSDAVPREKTPQLRSREITAGVQLFQRGHAAKLLVDAGRHRIDEADTRQIIHLFRMQYQLLF